MTDDEGEDDGDEDGHGGDGDTQGLMAGKKWSQVLNLRLPAYVVSTPPTLSYTLAKGAGEYEAEIAQTKLKPKC